MRQTGYCLYGLGAALATALATSVSATAPLYGVLIAAALVASLAVVKRAPATVLVFVGALLIMLSATGPVLPLGAPGASILLRLGGAVALIVSGVLQGDVRRPVRPQSCFIGAFLAAMGLYIVAATFGDSNYTAFTTYTAGLVVLGVWLIAVSSWVPAESLRVGLMAALAVFVVACLVCGLIAPGVGIEGGRLRGLADNANGLGCYAFALGAMAISVVRDRWVALVLLSLSAAATAWSGSRNSALALIVVVMIAIISAQWPIRVVSVLVAVSGTMIFTVAGGSLLLNTWVNERGNTRERTFDYAIHVMVTHPWSGIGLGNEALEVASTPMRALVEAGIWGGAAVFVMWAAILAYGRTAGALGFAVAVGIVVFSVFEGVLLSPIGPFLLILLGVSVSVQRFRPSTRPAKRDCGNRILTRKFSQATT